MFHAKCIFKYDNVDGNIINSTLFVSCVHATQAVQSVPADLILFAYKLYLKLRHERDFKNRMDFAVKIHMGITDYGILKNKLMPLVDEINSKPYVYFALLL